MTTINEQQKETLLRLGEHLRSNRIVQNDTQQTAAARIGVSLSTYKKMEQGCLNTKIDYWINAAQFYGKCDRFDEIFPQSLFEQKKNRKRVSRCKS